MKGIRGIAIILATLLLIFSFTFCCHADECSKLTIYQDSSGKEGVQNQLGEWVIPPIYDMISIFDMISDDGIYWVFIETGADNPAKMGLIDTKRGIAIPAHYDEILIGDELIVAFDYTTHVYDIFNKEWRLIYTLPGKYDYVVPNGAYHVDVVDYDGNIHTIQVPSYLGTAN